MGKVAIFINGLPQDGLRRIAEADGRWAEGSYARDKDACRCLVGHAGSDSG